MKLNSVLFIVCFLLQFSLYSQQDSLAKTKLIQIINSDDLIYEIQNGFETQRLKGNVVILHDGTYFYCDSAIHNVNANNFHAFSHVKVVMPDNVTLTCNRLNYDGNTRIAEAIGKAVATDGKAILSSEKLTYYRNEGYGKYTVGGKLTNADNVLTSQFGYYYPNDKMAYFKKNVKLVNPDYTLTTDTLGYNTDTETAIFMTTTNVESKDGGFITDKGTYDTKNQKLNLESRTKMKNDDYKMEADRTDFDNQTHLGVMIGNVFIQQKDTSFTLYADSATYNRETGLGHANGHVVMIQKDSASIITAKEGDFNKNTKTGSAYGNVVMIQKDSSMIITSRSADFDQEKKSGKAYENVIIRQKDSSFTVFADTATFNNETNNGTASGKVEIYQKDSTLSIFGGHAIFNRDSKETYIMKHPLAIQKFDNDSLYIAADTLYAKEDSLQRKTFKAFGNVKLYMNDMQGIADSMIYRYSDSLMILYSNPVLWSDSSQLSGDTMTIWLKHKKIDSLFVSQNGFLVSQEDTIGFNQIKGKQLRAKFEDNKLIRLHIVGNSESIYYIKDDEKGYQGMNQSVSQEMKIFLKDNKVYKILFIKKPESTYRPIFEVIFEEWFAEVVAISRKSLQNMLDQTLDCFMTYTA